MANDVVFKTKAFGGFNKDEVMDFVNKILAEKKDLEKRVAECNVKIAEANANANEYKSKAEQVDVLTEKIKESEEKIVVLENLQNECNDKISELNGVISQKDEEISILNQKLSDSVLSEDAEKEIEALRGENARLKIENDKKKDLERQVGAAMLDARVHSESLVEEAKEKANAVTKAVYSSIGEAALKIDDLSGGIGEIARNFQKSVEEVELRIKALTGDMSKTAQLLISDSNEVTAAAPSYEYDFTPKTDNEIVINPNNCSDTKE